MTAPSRRTRCIFSRLVACAAALLFTEAALPLAAAETALQLKDHDVWVMAGDGSTAQRSHTNYLEAYYRTRCPKLHLHFRNSGIGGNRTASVLARDGEPGFDFSKRSAAEGDQVDEIHRG